jgi:hypothetical protein
MNNKDNVISMEEYKKRKAREAEDCEAFFEGMPCFPDISVDSTPCFRDAPHPTREEMMRMFEDIPPLRFQVKAPQPKPSQPKPWYHWYTQQR